MARSIEMLTNLVRGDGSEEELGVEFRACANRVQQGDSYKMKVDLPFFNGLVDVEQVFYWICEVKHFFDVMRFDPECKVDFIANKLHGGVGAWWQRHQDVLRSRGQPTIQNWA
ncbi:hypothetical protein NC651_033627 [Populus alba x Populus x berolinensis]|nr:hypothetical protein NC651_033627 [Populus alba x Populus x berolinensis]